MTMITFPLDHIGFWFISLLCWLSVSWRWWWCAFLLKIYYMSLSSVKNTNLLRPASLCSLTLTVCDSRRVKLGVFAVWRATNQVFCIQSERTSHCTMLWQPNASRWVYPSSTRCHRLMRSRETTTWSWMRCLDSVSKVHHAASLQPSSATLLTLACQFLV